MEYGLIGKSLVHSFSKELHGLIDSYDYSLCELSENALKNFFLEKDFKGVNVTIPYKQTVIPMLDYIDCSAEKIGAVNTVVNRAGKLSGYNTDFSGMKFLIEKTYGDSFFGKKVLILGTGGTASTAFAVSKELGSEEIYLVSRSPLNDEISYKDALTVHNDAQIIINTTPVGMYPNTDALPIELDNFIKLELVVDAIYNPINTRLVLKAKEMNVKAVGGLLMLVAQAVFAYALFFDKEPSEKLVLYTYKTLKKQKQNIALIGMPSSGKTTIGTEIAEILGMQFIDTDQLIVKKAQKTIPEIFSQDGEECFRKLENEVVAEISKLNGAVISTGGGVVLNQENIENLKSNSLVFFLDRELSELLPTEDRPLANDLEKIKNLYNQRIDLYRNSADFIIKNKNIHDSVNEIISKR